jgi:hypothetical protein
MKESGVMESTRSTRWQEAKVFADVNARDMASPKPNIIEELYVWFKGVSLYHQGEIGGASTEQDRQMQKHILSTLTSMGEWLVSELRQHDITAKAGVTMADVEATLEELYVSLRISFGGMTETRRAQVLDEVFGAS